MKVKIKSKNLLIEIEIEIKINVWFTGWVSVATWRWVANDDNCGICRMPFESCCNECMLPGDDCPLGKFYF